MAAALARMIRGGRSSGSSPPLRLPAICRRGPQEGYLAGRILSHPGATAPACPSADLLGRLMHTGRRVPRSPLEALREKSIFIPGPVRYVPYESEEAILSLAERLDKLSNQLQMFRTHFKYLAAVVVPVVAIEVGLLIHNYCQLQVNKKSLEEFEAALEQVNTDLNELELLQRQIEQDLA